MASNRLPTFIPRKGVWSVWILNDPSITYPLHLYVFNFFYFIFSILLTILMMLTLYYFIFLLRLNEVSIRVITHVTTWRNVITIITCPKSGALQSLLRNNTIDLKLILVLLRKFVKIFYMAWNDKESF